MAIAFDSNTLGTATPAGSSSTTYSHTCSGTDRFLIVTCTTFNFSTITPTPTATYADVSMTVIAQNTAVFGTGNWSVHHFYLVNPTSGANNVVVTVGSGTGQLQGAAVSYTGVDQINPVLTSNTASSPGSGNTMQISLTTALPAWWFISGSNPDGPWTAGGNTSTIRDSFGNNGSADSNADVSAQTGNAQLSHAGSRGYGGAAIAFKAVGVVEENLAIFFGANF